MKNYLFLYLSILLSLLTSCATIFNGTTQRISIQEDDSIHIVSVLEDGNEIIRKNSKYKIARDADSVIIRYNIKGNDSLYSIPLVPFLSNAYWLNIAYSYGLGMLLDEVTGKKMAHLPRVYLTNDHQLVKEKKGNQNVTISTDYGLLIGNNSQWGTYYAVSILPYNLSLGYEYFHKHNTFLSITGFLIPMMGTFKQTKFDQSSIILLNTGGSIRNNHLFNSNFEVGYGIVINHINSNYREIENTKLGLSFIASMQLSNSFGMGFLYEPTYFNLNNYNTNLEHNFKYQMRFKIKN